MKIYIDNLTIHFAGDSDTRSSSHITYSDLIKEYPNLAYDNIAVDKVQLDSIISNVHVFLNNRADHPLRFFFSRFSRRQSI